MTNDKAIEIANKMQLSGNPLWLEVKRLAGDYEKQIAELEQKLEQAEKDLADYQFNYPTIKELQKENTELKEKWLQATDEGTSWAHLKCLERENEELKEFIKNIIRVTWGEGWNYSLDWKVKAEQYLKDLGK